MESFEQLATEPAALSRRELRERERAFEVTQQQVQATKTHTVFGQTETEPAEPAFVQAPTSVSQDLPTRRSRRAAEQATPGLGHVQENPFENLGFGSPVVNQPEQTFSFLEFSTNQLKTEEATKHKVPRSRRSRLKRKSTDSVQTATSYRTRRRAKRGILSQLMTLGAMIGVGLMMISTSIPANAFFKPSNEAFGTADTAAHKQASQKVLVSADSGSLAVVRDAYTATSWKEQVFLRYGNRGYAYTPNPNGVIQWPFPIAVPISDGFGWRVSPCAGCSTWHKGTDFTPGKGAIIGSIAEGVVSKVEASHAGLGNHVIVDSQINGHLVQSVYAHMEDNSFRVVVGQHVMAGDELGLVGSTGESTGAHLHLEIHVDGVPVDPFEWLKENAH